MSEDDFSARLAAARRQAGLEPAAAPADTQDTPSPWGIGARVGVELLSALVVGLGLGWALDRWLHTRPLFLIVFVLLGGVAGVLNVWRMMAPGGPRRS